MKNYKRILAMIFVLALLAGLCACGGNSQSALKGAAFDTAAVTAEAAPMEEMVMAQENGYGFAEAEEFEAPAEQPLEQQADFSSKIIYSANVSLQTKEFDKVISALEQSVKDVGGFIENSSVDGSVQYLSDGTTETVDRYAYYTVRIPCEQFEAFLNRSQTLGNVTSLNKNAENVTSTYSDYEARLASLKTEQTRLLELLAKAENVDAIITIEQRLSEVRYETDSIEQNLRNLDRQITYSTVTLNVSEVAVYTPTASKQRTFGERFADAFRDGWRDFGYFMQDLAVWLIGALPALILIAVIVVAAVWIIRRAKRKVKKENTENK